MINTLPVEIVAYVIYYIQSITGILSFIRTFPEYKDLICESFKLTYDTTKKVINLSLISFNRQTECNFNLLNEYDESILRYVIDCNTGKRQYILMETQKVELDIFDDFDREILNEIRLSSFTKFDRQSRKIYILLNSKKKLQNGRKKLCFHLYIVIQNYINKLMYNKPYETIGCMEDFILSYVNRVIDMSSTNFEFTQAIIEAEI